MDSLPWFIHRLSSMIGSASTTTRHFSGQEFRAVPEPYQAVGFDRVRAAWWVLAGRAHAVIWPQPGELEIALERTP